MRLLILSPYYHPYINPRAFRWTAIAQHWAKQGVEVHVICSKRDGWEREGKHEGVWLHRTGFNSLKEVFYFLSRPASRRGEASPMQATMRRGRLNQALLFFNEWFWKPFYWPDDAFIWQKPAYRKAKQLLRKYQFDGLITISLPFSTHLVGLRLQRHFPELPWLADIGDPFSIQKIHPLNNQWLYHRKNKRTEQAVLQQANLLTITNQGLAHLYQTTFNCPAEKLKTVPPLFGQVQKITPTNRVRTEALQLGYFGSFFKGVREPGPLLAFFEQLIQTFPEETNNLQFHFFGDIFEPFQLIFRKFPLVMQRSQLHGLQGRAEAFQSMLDMDILFNIGNRSSFQLPSKSADYLASGKPIVNFAQIEQDTTAAFFKDYPLFLNLPVEYQPTQAVKFLHFVRSNRGKSVPSTTLKKALAPYTIEQIAADYRSFFETE